ncbi:MAG: TolC family protein, partial [Planctomycetia bacterium]|nr:TolC family protein [Planctomycetia bacterium]
IHPSITELRAKLTDWQTEIRQKQNYDEIIGRMREPFSQTYQICKTLEEDFRRLNDVIPERLKALNLLAQRAEFQSGNVDFSTIDPDKFLQRVETAKENYKRFLAQFKSSINSLKRIKEINTEDFNREQTSRIQISLEECQQEETESGTQYFTKVRFRKVDQADGSIRLNAQAEYVEEIYPVEVIRIRRYLSANVDEKTLSDTEKFDYHYYRNETPEEKLIRIIMMELNAWIDEFNSQMLELSLIQAAVRLDAIMLVPVVADEWTAVQLARDNRLDWMNARAVLVDQWRQIELAANRLKSDLTFTVDGGVSAVSGGSDSRGTVSNINVGLSFDAPLTRREERNNYVSALISYDRARRDYMNYEDSVHQSIRTILRDMELAQMNFELQRAQVFTAMSQVEQKNLQLLQPLQMGQTSDFGDNFSSELVNSLNALMETQNTFIDSWISFEVSRMGLDITLGTFRLNSEGVWIDPGPLSLGKNTQITVENLPAGSSESQSGQATEMNPLNSTPTLQEPLIEEWFPEGQTENVPHDGSGVSSSERSLNILSERGSEVAENGILTEIRAPDPREKRVHHRDIFLPVENSKEVVYHEEKNWLKPVVSENDG